MCQVPEEAREQAGVWGVGGSRALRLVWLEWREGQNERVES